jgi:hypothetical protein
LTGSKTFTGGAAAAALALGLAAPGLADGLKLEFHSFAAVDMVEQDVFIEKSDGMVYRIAAADVAGSMDAMLYGATESPPFQPMNLTPTKGYGKGIDLEMTLAEWLSAKGEGSFDCVDGKSVVEASFSGLAPNAVYTMWNFIDAEPPTDPWQGILYPLGARDGADATFESDAEGNATYSATFEPCLQMTGTQTLSGLAIAWHPDGKTHGASPGMLGVDSFAQLMTALIDE